jgi:hypothetical protein
MEWIEIGFPDWNWDERLSVEDNLNKYKFFHPYIIPVMLLLLAFVIKMWAKAFYVDVFAAKDVIEGVVLETKQSATRVNNKNLTNIRVEYLGLKAWFDDNNADLMFQLKPGDKVNIRYNKDKPEQAVFAGLVSE